MPSSSMNQLKCDISDICTLKDPVATFKPHVQLDLYDQTASVRDSTGTVANPEEEEESDDDDAGLREALVHLGGRTSESDALGRGTGGAGRGGTSQRRDLTNARAVTLSTNKIPDDANFSPGSSAHQDQNDKTPGGMNIDINATGALQATEQPGSPAQENEHNEDESRSGMNIDINGEGAVQELDPPGGPGQEDENNEDENHSGMDIDINGEGAVQELDPPGSPGQEDENNEDENHSGMDIDINGEGAVQELDPPGSPGQEDENNEDDNCSGMNVDKEGIEKGRPKEAGQQTRRSKMSPPSDEKKKSAVAGDKRKNLPRKAKEKQKEDLSPPAPKPQSKPRPQPRPQPKPKPQPAVQMKGRAQSADIVARTYFEEIELGGLNTLLEVIDLTQDHTVSHIYLKTTLAFKFSRRLNLTNQTL